MIKDKIKQLITEGYISKELKDFYMKMLLKAGIGRNTASRELDVLFSSPEWEKINSIYNPLYSKILRDMTTNFPYNMAFGLDPKMYKNPLYIKLNNQLKEVKDKWEKERKILIQALIKKLKDLTYYLSRS